MTLFKVNKISPNFFTVSFLYFCAPLTHSISHITLEIKPPNCDPVILTWRKECVDVLGRNLIIIAPHPGLQADLVNMDTGRVQQFIRDGLPMYPNLRTADDILSKGVDDMIPEFVISDPTFHIKFYTKLDAVNIHING